MSTPKSKRDTPLSVVVVGIVLAPLLLVILPVVLSVAIVLYVLRTIFLHITIWSSWCVRGRDILFVYSDSPIWHDYIEQNILPYLGKRAVILNWSERKRWPFSLSRMAFYHFGQHEEFNPLAVVFRPFKRTRTFRFWQPFQDFKHGQPEALKRMETEFFRLIGDPQEAT